MEDVITRRQVEAAELDGQLAALLQQIRDENSQNLRGRHEEVETFYEKRVAYHSVLYCCHRYCHSHVSDLQSVCIVVYFTC